jgi:hypothetical protein
MVVLAAGIGWLSLVPVGGTFVANVLLATLVAATGMSLAYIPAMLAALAGPRPEEGGLASGIVNTTYQVGSALGLAAMSAVAASVGAGSAGTTAGLVVGFQAAFVGAAALALAGAAVAALMIGRPSRGAQPAPGSGDARNPEPAAARELTGAGRA